MILGIDEVGRGAWAGPMVVGAVVLGEHTITGLTDSKKLTKRARERLAIEIKQQAAGIGLGWVSARLIDKVGLSRALKIAAERAVSAVTADYDEIIIDGTIRLVDGPAVTTVPKADLLVPAVSAASIVAKVARDDYMARIDERFEGYGMGSHVGYGTAAHLAAIKTHGVLPIHRTSFAPIAKMIGTAADVKPQRIEQTAGRQAEHVAAEYLSTLGHQLLHQNWKTSRCEIDLVSRFNDKLYFTEVKYRRLMSQGGGMAAITPTKLKQMQYASDRYVTTFDLNGSERTLSVLTLTGSPPQVETYIESI